MNSDQDPARRVRDEFAETGVSQSAAAAPGEQAGDVIDRYKLLQEIGEGGMGTVWMAEQKEPVKRQVALKIIKLGMDTKEVVIRFEAERQALALMDHPNIAKVLDGGSTDNGRPFFVMELVRGVPITQYCDEQKLGIRNRLELFTKVCEAIQHAHHKGVIHRDIKPSNVMVTMHDGVPVPKVIDFGIAKATSVELTQKTLFTQYGNMIGTPEYMAPEQAEMSGLDIDTRADVYSLGVLLYELLTGSKPFEITKVLEKGYQELLRTIREEDPAKPSTRVSTMGERTPIAKGQANVDKLSNRLRGDLDWIVMRALEKDRTRRYETANGFAADVGRYLVGDPVHAAPPSSTYRLKKFLARRRKVVAAVAVIAFLLVAGTVGTGLGWWEAHKSRVLAEAAAGKERKAREDADAAAEKARKNEQVAIEQREAARRELARAVEMKGVLENMLNGVTPDWAKDADTRLLKWLLSITAKKITDGEIEDELVQAELGYLLGHTYAQMSEVDLARPILEAAVEAQERLLGGTNRATLQSKLDLAELKRDQGAMEHVLAVRREAFGPNDTDTLMSGLVLAIHAMREGRYQEAVEGIEEVFEPLQAALGKDHRFVLRARNTLGDALTLQGKVAEAEAVLRTNLEAHIRRFGESFPGTIMNLRLLANCIGGQGRYAEVEQLYLKELALTREVFGEGSEAGFSTYSNLGQLYNQLGKYGQAEQVFTETVEFYRKRSGEDDPDTLFNKVQLANVYVSQSRFAEAELLYRDAVPKLIRTKGEHDLHAISGRLQFGQLLLLQGNVEEAERVYRAGLAASREKFGQQHDLTLLMRLGLVGCDQARGRMAEAAKKLTELLADARSMLGPEHPNTLLYMAELGDTYGALQRYQEAEALFEECVDKMRRVLGEEHPWTKAAVQSLAGISLSPVGPSGAAKVAPKSDGTLAGDVARAWHLLENNGEQQAIKGALDLAEKAVKQTRGVDVGALQVLAEALFANGQSGEAVTRMYRGVRAWHSMSPADQKALGKRDLEWMQGRIGAYER